MQNAEDRQFLYETTADTEVGQVARELAEVHNLRMRIGRLKVRTRHFSSINGSCQMRFVFTTATNRLLLQLEGEELAKYGPAKDPNLQGLDEYQKDFYGKVPISLRQLFVRVLTRLSTRRLRPSAISSAIKTFEHSSALQEVEKGQNYTPDPTGRRTGNAADPVAVEKLRQTLADAAAAASKDQVAKVRPGGLQRPYRVALPVAVGWGAGGSPDVDRPGFQRASSLLVLAGPLTPHLAPARAQKVKLTKKTLEEAIDNVRGAVMICFPMGLPEYDGVRHILEGDEDLSGTSYANDDLDPEETVVWYCGKQMDPKKRLQDHVGKNEKTKVVVKIQKRGASAPSREPGEPEGVGEREEQRDATREPRDVERLGAHACHVGGWVRGRMTGARWPQWWTRRRTRRCCRGTTRGRRSRRGSRRTRTTSMCTRAGPAARGSSRASSG